MNTLRRVRRPSKPASLTAKVPRRRQLRPGPLVSLAAVAVLLSTGCGAATEPIAEPQQATSPNPASPQATTPSPRPPQTATPLESPSTRVATGSQLIAVAQEVYGRDFLSTCERGTDPNTLFDACPFTAVFRQTMITKAKTQLGPDPLGLGDGPGLQGTPSYTASVTATGGTVVMQVGGMSFTIIEVWQDGTLLVGDINGW